MGDPACLARLLVLTSHARPIPWTASSGMSRFSDILGCFSDSRGIKVLIMSKKHRYMSGSELFRFLIVACCLCIPSSDIHGDEPRKAPDCPEVEMIAEALQAICSKDWESLTGNAVQQTWPEPLLRVSEYEAQTWPEPPPREHDYVPQTRPAGSWALLVDEHPLAEDGDYLCSTSFYLEISQGSEPGVVTENVEDITIKRTAEDNWEAWRIGMRLLRAIDLGSGGKVCDYSVWRLEDKGTGGYWWCQHRDRAEGGTTYVGAITFAISRLPSGWEVFLTYSRILEDAAR